MQAYPLLESEILTKCDMEPFGEKLAISAPSLPLLPRFGSEKEKPKMATVELKEKSIVRENVLCMIRLKQIRRHMYAIEKEEASAEAAFRLDPVLLQVLDTKSLREIPKQLEKHQVAMLMKESVVLAALHNGFDEMEGQAVETLVEIGLQFMEQFMQLWRMELDKGFPCRYAPLVEKKERKLTRLSVPRHHFALAGVLNRLHCPISRLQHHLANVVKFSDHLKSVDRALSKKATKSLCKMSSCGMTLTMKQSLDNAELDFCSFHGTLQSTQTQVPVPERKKFHFQDPVEKKQKVQSESSFSDINMDQFSLGHFDEDKNSIDLDTALDLSNLDDFFEGDAMLADDLLPNLL